MAFTNFVHIPLTREQGVKRATSQKDKGLYKLGGGTRSCKSETPFDDANGCDCSNFAVWTCGLNKYQPEVGRVYADPEFYFNSDAIIRDAEHNGKHLVFETVPSNETVLPGDIIVYGSVYVHGERTPGHVVVVTEGSITPAQRHGCKFVHNGVTYMTFDTRLIKVTNCAPRHGVWPGAVRTQSPAAFPRLRTDGYIVRYKHWVESAAVAQVAVVATPPTPIQVTAPTSASTPIIAELAKLFPKQTRKRNPNFWPSDMWLPGRRAYESVYA